MEARLDGAPLARDSERCRRLWGTGRRRDSLVSFEEGRALYFAQGS